MTITRLLVHLTYRASRGLSSRVRNLYYKILGVNILGYVWMRNIEISRNWQDITLEPDVSLDHGTVLLCSGDAAKNKLVIRSGTYVNRYTIFDAHEHLEIGKDCMIGPHCYLTDADHRKVAGKPVKSQPMETSAVILEDEVWLGTRVTVLPGVTIGTGAVVGAGSVVTKSIPAGAIAYGVPATVKRVRT